MYEHLQRMKEAAEEGFAATDERLKAIAADLADLQAEVKKLEKERGQLTGLQQTYSSVNKLPMPTPPE